MKTAKTKSVEKTLSYKNVNVKTELQKMDLIMSLFDVVSAKEEEVKILGSNETFTESYFTLSLQGCDNSYEYKLNTKDIEASEVVFECLFGMFKSGDNEQITF